MSDSEKYLKGHDLTGDISVPQLDLGGNYISYKQGPASPDNEGVEGWVKMAPDGIYFYSDGRWRKTPAYTLHWSDLSEDVRFLPINKDITLTDDEKQRLRSTIDIQVATQTLPGLVRGSSMSMSSGAVQITYDGRAIVPQATSQYAGAVRVTESSLDGYAPIVTTKLYVDQRITERGTIPPASGDTLGGVKKGGDIADINDGIIIANKASFTNTPAIPSFGIVHIAPPEFTPDSTEYDDRTNETGIAQYPWLTTVSQTKAIAENKALVAIDSINRNNFIQYTPEGQEVPVPGFVRVMPGSGLDIVLTGDHAGDISVQHAGVNTWGNVKIYDGTDSGASDLVPYMGLVLSYVLNLGYLTEVDTATYTSKGILSVHSGRGLTISDAGELSIQYAQSNQQGVVKVQPVQSESTVALHTVPTVGYMEDRIPTVISGYYALATLDGGTTGRAGIVRIKCTGGESEGAPFYVPSYDKMVQYVDSKSGLSTLDVLAVLAGNDAKVIGGSLTANCYAQFNTGAVFNEVRPTISITTPPNTENPNDILTRAEIEELVGGSGGGGGGTLPSWVHYDVSDSTLEISANEVTLTTADNTEGPATLNTGDLNVNGSIDCQNGSVLATNFMGKVDTSRSYVSFGTYEQQDIILVQQRDAELGRSDSNVVTINGTLVIDSESYGKSTVKLYGLEPGEASDSIRITGNLLFDDIDIASSKTNNISNVNNLTMTGKLVAGETLLQAPGQRAKREVVTSTIPLVSGALYLISITCQDGDGNWIDDIVDGSLVDAEDAVERAVDIINSVSRINIMYRAVLSEDKATTTVYAVHYGNAWNGKQLEITFTKAGDPSTIETVTFLLADGSDQGDVLAAHDPLLLVNGNVTVEGKIRLTNPSAPGANDLITKSNAEDIVTEATQYPLGDGFVTPITRQVKDNWIYRIKNTTTALTISMASVVARRPAEIHVHNSTSPLNPAWPNSWLWGNNGVFNTSNPAPTMRANTIAVINVRKHVVDDSTSYVLAELVYEIELP